jgi:hypothetical protein
LQLPLVGIETFITGFIDIDSLLSDDELVSYLEKELLLYKSLEPKEMNQEEEDKALDHILNLPLFNKLDEDRRTLVTSSISKLMSINKDLQTTRV